AHRFCFLRPKNKAYGVIGIKRLNLNNSAKFRFFFSKINILKRGNTMLPFWEKILCCMLVLGILSLSFGELAASSATLDPRKEPSQADWQFFFQADASWRQKLWVEKTRQNYRFADWDWTWRMGWLKSCDDDRSALCLELTMAALADKAILVRT